MLRRDTSVVSFDPEITKTEKRIRAKLKRLREMEPRERVNAVNPRDGIEQQVEYDEHGLPIPRNPADPVNERRDPPPPQHVGGQYPHVPRRQQQPPIRRTIRDYAQPVGNHDEDELALEEPELPFVIAPAFLTMLLSQRFGGEDNENPHEYIDWFKQISSTMRINGWTREGMMGAGK